MAPLSVLIIGGGAIAGGYDAGRREGPPLTHAGAFTADERFHLAAVMEPDATRREAFQTRWAVPRGLASLGELKDRTFDVISVCSPTEHHAAHIEAALALRPRLIFAEKPVAKSAADAERLVQAAEREGVALAVNHTRRWDAEVIGLANDLRQGHWGAIRSVTGVYTKGVVHNGGHLIDILRLLLGELTVQWAGAPVHDFWDDDPSMSAILVSEHGVAVHLSPGHAGDYALFELTVVTEQGVIQMLDGGMGWWERRAGDSAHFPGYRALLPGETRPGGYPLAMTNAVDNIARALMHGAPLACTGQDAAAAQRLCEQIRDRALVAPNGPKA